MLLFSIAMLSLGFLNRGLEAWKWMILSSKNEDIRFLAAYKSVLAGMAIGFITPAKSGEVIGRNLFVPKQSLLQTLSLTISSGFFQTFATLLFGSFGLLLLLAIENQNNFFVFAYNTIFIFFLGMILLLFIAIYFYPKKLKKTLQRLPFIKKITLRSSSVFFNHNRNEMQQLTLLSVVRYGVFLFQFLFALYFCGVREEFYILFSLSTSVFLISGFIPSSLFGKIGVRESIALFVFLPFGFETNSILCASFLVWIFNQAIPATTGAFLILFRKKIQNL